MTTSMVGLKKKNGHIHKNLIKMVNPRDITGEHRRRRKRHRGEPQKVASKEATPTASANRARCKLLTAISHARWCRRG